MSASTNSSVGALGARGPGNSLESHELFSQVLPLLVADTQEQIAQGARQLARQQVDHAIDRHQEDLVKQMSGWLDLVSSTFREEVDLLMASIYAEWGKQIERAFDPIRAAMNRQVAQAVQAVWSDHDVPRTADGRERGDTTSAAAGAATPSAAETGREKKVTRRSAPRATKASANKTREKQTKPKESGESPPKATARSSRASAAGTSPTRSPAKQPTKRSASGNSSARAPARRPQSRSAGSRAETGSSSRKKE